ncbi:MAG: hypothetical protein WBD37_08850 [Anderseniella sp.]
MSKLITATGLAGAFVLIAAFSPYPTMPVHTDNDNVTVIYKTNTNWPVRGLMSADPCAIRTCQAI